MSKKQRSKSGNDSKDVWMVLPERQRKATVAKLAPGCIEALRAYRAAIVDDCDAAIRYLDALRAWARRPGRDGIPNALPTVFLRFAEMADHPEEGTHPSEWEGPAWVSFASRAVEALALHAAAADDSPTAEDLARYIHSALDQSWPGEAIDDVRTEVERGFKDAGIDVTKPATRAA